MGRTVKSGIIGMMVTLAMWGVVGTGLLRQTTALTGTALPTLDPVRALQTARQTAASIIAPNEPRYIPVAQNYEAQPRPVALLGARLSDLAFLGEAQTDGVSTWFVSGPYTVVVDLSSAGLVDRAEVRTAEPMTAEVIAALIRREVGDSPARRVSDSTWVTPYGTRITIRPTAMVFASPSAPLWASR